MSTRNISRWAGGLHVPIVFKSGNLNLLEPSGPVQACTGISLPNITIKAMNPFHPISFSDLKSSDNSKICCFSFSSYSMALLPIFGQWHPCCRDFETIEFLRGEDISLTSNPQTCRSGYLFGALAPRSTPLRHGCPLQRLGCRRNWCPQTPTRR